MRRGAHGSPGELRSPGRSYDTETVFYHFSGSVCLFRHIVPMLPPPHNYLIIYFPTAFV